MWGFARTHTSMSNIHIWNSKHISYTFAFCLDGITKNVIKNCSRCLTITYSTILALFCCRCCCRTVLNTWYHVLVVLWNFIWPWRARTWTGHTLVFNTYIVPDCQTNRNTNLQNFFFYLSFCQGKFSSSSLFEWPNEEFSLNRWIYQARQILNPSMANSYTLLFLTFHFIYICGIFFLSCV